MTGLAPAIHTLPCRTKNVDARDKCLARTDH
jgi:hypothetical protein